MKLSNILGFFKNLFRIGINYKKLYSSVWNKEKSDYLRKKIKGIRTIHWYEKRGKGSYFDKKLKGTVNFPMHGFDDEVLEAQKSSQDSPFKQTGKPI